MKVVLVIDSFKGTLASRQVEDVLEKALTRKGIECVKIPVSDGGEGLMDSLSLLGGEKIKVNVCDPNFSRVDAEYLLRGNVAVIETAQAAGLPLSCKTAAETTTFGVGEMILDAEKRGATTFVLGLGGSATNDCGCGMAAALGFKFFDKEGNSFIPVGKTLSDITRIELGKKRKIVAFCDVKNPLYGPNGAAYVFAPQKGASPEEVKLLDNGLKSINEVFLSQGIGDFNVEGAGAAGGLGAGVLAFSDGSLKRGINAVLDAVEFDALVADADYVITGEGKLDSQSFGGKVIDGVIERKGKAKAIAVVGTSLIDDANKYGLEKVFETNPEHRPFEEIKANALNDLIKCAEKVSAYLGELL